METNYLVKFNLKIPKERKVVKKYTFNNEDSAIKKMRALYDKYAGKVYTNCDYGDVIEREGVYQLLCYSECIDNLYCDVTIEVTTL